MFLATCKLSVLASLLIGGALGTVVLAQQGRVQTGRIEASSRDADRSPSRTTVRPGATAVLSTPRKQYEALIAEFISESERDTAEFAKLKSEPEKKAYLQANYPVEKKVVGRFLELARTHPDDPAAFDAMAWLAIWGFKSAESDAAAAILARDYAEDRRLWLICEDMRRGPISLARTPLLRAVLGRNPDRNTRGRACFDLAQLLTEQAEFVRLLKTPGLMPGQAKFYPEPRLEPFRALDPAALTMEADHLFQRVLDEFPDVVPVKWWTVTPRMENMDPSTLYRKIPEPELDHGTLADRARSALDEIRNLNVGKTAPEIEGVDVGGRTFKLSDYRGKVVVVDFSGSWCGFCKEMYPHLREIVDRLKDRPFALLSVMADEKKEAIQKEIAAGEITWRCWWEKGGVDGAIPRAWNVHGYPTVYVLDHKGVIRLKFTGILSGGDAKHQPPIDQLLETLVKECESDRKP